jgi:mono/diheme cytochrome c family protein
MKRLLPTLLASLVIAWAPPAAGADTVRGRALYESRCGGCHAESVHGRARREAGGFEALRGWVRRWSANLGLRWTADEVDDVAVYLNGRYYRFPCPPSACRPLGRAGAPQVTASGPAGAS